MNLAQRISPDDIAPALLSLDVGYGNLKAVWMTSPSGELQNLVLPVGAARSNQALKHLGSSRLSIGDGEIVTIDGDEWVAGVNPLDLQRFARPTHENYPLTKEYLALVYAALAKVGATRIRRLVTGLPVSQIYGQQPSPSMAERLIKRLQGVHSISPTLAVEIEQVIVVPQPAGAFRARLAADRTFAADKYAITAVVDVGYYSSDWALLRGVNIMDEQSGSTTEATSRILEQACGQIAVSYPDVEISESRIESAFRDGLGTINAGKHEIELKPFISAAAQKVCKDVVVAIQKKRRGSSETINTILVTGGGASLIAPFLENSFKGARILLSDDSVTANATGFCLIARDRYLQDMKSKQKTA